MAELPTGTVTFLFSDLEGSTRLWEANPEAMRTALAAHDEIVRGSIESSSGYVVKTTGDGFHAVFATAHDALAAAVDAQLRLERMNWGEVGKLRVRMSIHSGEAEPRDGDYYGPTLNRAARLMAIAHGGQVVVSLATEQLVRDSLAPSVGLVDLGAHRLRDLARPEVVFQLSHPDLVAEFPALRSLDAFPGNLPIERTSLVGREQELAKLAGLLEQHRLVSLTGVGGVGKTRLAVHLAATSVERFPDGAWLVALAPIREAALVPGAVAAALGIPDQPGRAMVEVLRDAIGSRVMLVVVDNCEHVLEPAAHLVDTLLDACVGLRIVATSREALGVEGEQVFHTPSLRVPDLELASSMDEVAPTEAVELFVERAHSVQPEFTLSAENASAVAGLCARLDGIPLALELAAARVSTLSPKDILERIDQRFRLLTGGSRTALERHQTLQAAVDWSYELLNHAERRFFDRLSVFVGGFTLEAARAVAAVEGTEEFEVLDLLGSLIAKSMVIAEVVGDSIRYRLLETLRQYGRDCLVADGDAEDIRECHANYYLEFAEALADAYFGPDELAAWDRLIGDLENARAAFDWLVDRGEGLAVVRFMRAVGGGWNDNSDALRRNERGLAIVRTLPAADRVSALAVAGFQHINAGTHQRATDLCQESVDCAREAGVSPDSTALASLGFAAFWSNDPLRAVAAFEEAVALAQAQDDGSARQRHALAANLSATCFVLGQMGETDRAIEAGEQALAIARDLGGPYMLNTTLWQLALACQTVQPERAAALLDEWQDHEVGRVFRSTNLLGVGQVRAALGDDQGALETFIEFLSLTRQRGDRFLVPNALQAIARLIRRAGDLETATCLLGAAEAVREEVGIPGGPAEVATRARAIASLRSALGTERFNANWEAGRALSYDTAIDFAIKATIPAP